MKLELVRYAYLPTCTLGRLHFSDQALDTIEDAWRPDPDGPGGQRREGALLESCVPDGLYELVPHDGNKWQNVHALVNAQLGVYHQVLPAGQLFGRTAILMHSGVTDDSSLGCIILGLRAGIENGRHRVYDSATALERLRARLGRSIHQLQIRPRAGTTE